MLYSVRTELNNSLGEVVNTVIISQYISAQGKCILCSLFVSGEQGREFILDMCSVYK